MGTFVDLTGKVFGNLTVLSVAGKTKSGNYLWKCRCTCGKERIVRSGHLNNGHTSSCGDAIHSITYKHGLWDSRIHVILKMIKRRCYNKSNRAYKYYGGRGIKVCAEWLDKENGYLNFINWAFKNGYKDNLTIDRIDVDGDYCPENCRWISMREQNRNKRNNVYYLVNGEKLCQTDCCKKVGLKDTTLFYRKGALHLTEIKDLFKGVDFAKYKIEKVEQ